MRKWDNCDNRGYCSCRGCLGSGSEGAVFHFRGGDIFLGVGLSLIIVKTDRSTNLIALILLPWTPTPAILFVGPQLELQGVYSNALKLVEDVGKGHSDLHIKPSNRASHQTLSKLSVNAEPTFVSLSKGQHGSF